MRGVFESEGDIRSVDLLTGLVALWREKAGGALRFSRPGTTAGFDLVEGEVVATLSSQAQFDTAAILARAGKLDPAAVGRLTVPEGGDAAAAAMQAGLITAREWRWGQKIRAIEVLSDLLGWLEGEYVREAGVPLPPGDWTLGLPRLVLELFLRTRDRTLVEHYLGPSDLPLLRAAGFDGEFETFGLTADAGAVVGLIDGRASAEEIAERSNADEFAVLKLLAALTTLGLVHPAEAAPAAPPRRSASAVRESKREPATPSAESIVEKEEARPEIEPEGAGDREAAAESESEEVPADEIEPEHLPPAVPGEAWPPPEPERREPREEPAETVPPPASAPEPIAAKRISSPEDHAVRPERGAEAIDPVVDLTGGGEPPVPPRRGSAAVLLGILAALVIAVAVLLMARSRGAGREQTVPAKVAPTAAENPVFPPAETAVPLPTHGKASRTPARTASASPAPIETPTASLAVAVPPTRVPTPVPATPPPTEVPTLPAPTKSPTAVPTRPLPTKPPTVAPTRPVPTKPPTAVPTRPVPTRPPTAKPAAPVPTRLPTPIPTRGAALPPPPTAVTSARGELTRADWIRRAERDRELLSRRRGVRYAVQLELACEVETLQKAWNWDKPSGTIWLLTTSYRGRTCFRVLWGRYGSLAQAREARARVPDFFTAPGNRPTVVSVR
jgi:hypothetical protein